MGQVKLTNILEKTARNSPDKSAVTFNDKTLTWKIFLHRIQLQGGALQALGVKAGDRVAVLSRNTSSMAEVFFGPFYANAIVVPLNFRWTKRELLACLEDSTPKVLFVGDGFVDIAVELQLACRSCDTLIYIGAKETPSGFLDYESMLAGATPSTEADRGGEDIGAIFYTGGTTGRSKGAMLSHNNLFSNALGSVAAYQTIEEGVFLQSAPIFHVAAGARVYTLVMAKCRSVFIDKFDPQEVATLIENQGITDGLFVPTMLNMMLNSGVFGTHDLSSLRGISYGASPMPEALIRQIIAKLPNVRFTQGYGMTEASPLVTVLTHDAHILGGLLSDKLSSIGKPAFHCEVRIVDEHDADIPAGSIGELIVRGPNIMLGYWNMPEATQKALRGDWYYTGDIGYFDEDGYIFLVDRMDDMIISGGENIYSSEVESAIYEHPAVKECAVIGIPDAKWGETVHAVITLKEGAKIDQKQLADFCRDRIAGYKVPRSMEVIENMPLSGVNKILKNTLRERFLSE